MTHIRTHKSALWYLFYIWTTGLRSTVYSPVGVYRELCLQVVRHKHECEVQGARQHLEVTRLSWPTCLEAVSFTKSYFCVTMVLNVPYACTMKFTRYSRVSEMSWYKKLLWNWYHNNTIVLLYDSTNLLTYLVIIEHLNTQFLIQTCTYHIYHNLEVSHKKHTTVKKHCCK